MSSATMWHVSKKASSDVMYNILYKSFFVDYFTTVSICQNSQHHNLCEDLTKLNVFSVKQILTISLFIVMSVSRYTASATLPGVRRADYHPAHMDVGGW
jgi:hypothetical protein